MIDLKNYQKMIYELVEAEDAADNNWNWSVKSISRNRCLIRWGYLDYCEEKENCFILQMDRNCGEWLFAMTPQKEVIECYMVTECMQGAPKIGAMMTIKAAIDCAIEEISHYAHSRY